VAPAGWCSDCGQYVRVRPDGSCVNGHAATRASNTCETSPVVRTTPPDREGVSTAHVLSAATHYDVLGLPANASIDVIKSAYKRLAKATHPDVNPSDALAHAKFIRVQEAYEILCDAAKRAQYDRLLGRLSGSVSYWSPKIDININISFSMSYYGYMIPLEVMDRAYEEASRVAAETGISQAEAVSRLLLDPLIRADEEKLRRHSRDVSLLLKLADLYFHTYRSPQALEYYSKAFSASDTQATAEQAVHLGTVYFYAGEYWGGIEHLGRLLTGYPRASEESRTRWAEEAERLIRAAQKTAVEGLAPEAQLELGISFLEKRCEFGHQPSSKDLKAIGDLAVKAGQMALAADYLRRARAHWLSPSEASALMRSFASAGLDSEAIAIGLEALPDGFLERTLKDPEKRLARALGEAYKQAGMIGEALAIYKKLARYRDASASLKKKVDKLSELTRSQRGAAAGSLPASGTES